VPLIYHEVMILSPTASGAQEPRRAPARQQRRTWRAADRRADQPGHFPADEIINFALQGRGAVIRGWGATHLLQDVPHAVCVRVCAPFEVRKQRMLDRVGSDDDGKVSEEIHNSDEAHGAIMRRNFSVQWSEPEHYDLVLNTRRVGIDECVNQIIGSSIPPNLPRPRSRANGWQTWRSPGARARRCGFRRAPAMCASRSARGAADLRLRLGGERGAAKRGERGVRRARRRVRDRRPAAQ